MLTDFQLAFQKNPILWSGDVGAREINASPIGFWRSAAAHRWAFVSKLNLQFWRKEQKKKKEAVINF